MGFLNKTRETAGLKGPVGKDGKKKVATAVIPEATAQQEKKPQKAALLNFFKTSSHATANSQYNNNPPPPPYTPVDPSLQQQQQEQPQQQIPIVPVIATQIPILNTPAPKITTTPSTSTPAAASPLDWHIPDLIFMVEGKRIPSHKVVLISRCAHFARLLTDIPAGSVTTIEIVDFPHHIFSRFVRLVYGGKKDNISPEDAPELVRCALQYEAPEIATICQEVVAEANEKLKAEQEERERQEMLLKQQQQQLEQEQQIQAYPQPTEMELQQQMQLQLQMQYYQQQQQQQQQQFQQQQQQLYQQQQFGFAEQQQQQQQQQEHYEQQQQQMQLGFEIDMANFVTAEESLQAFDNNYGMNMWSNDPVLFNANENSFEMNEGYRIMEIC